MKPKIPLSFKILTFEDIFEEKSKFQLKIRTLFSNEKISIYSIESIFSALSANSSKNVSNPNETQSFANLINNSNFRRLKRNNSSEAFSNQIFTNYLKFLETLCKIKMGILLNINCILWAKPEIETCTNLKDQMQKQKLWKQLIMIFKELIESESIILTKSNLIHLICETQKLLESLKKKDSTLKQIAYEILIGLKKIGRILHLSGLLSKIKEKNSTYEENHKMIQADLKRQPMAELTISNFTHFYEKSKLFQTKRNFKNKDQILEYCKWKLKNWAFEKQKEKSLKEIQIKCKICLKDIPCSIFRDHSEYCKERGFLCSNFNKLRKNAMKFVSLFQEIRIYLLTKTKMDIKNLRNIKTRYELSSHTFLLKSQTMVPLDSLKFLDLESINPENESIDDGCSMEIEESPPNLVIEKTQSTPFDMTESITLRQSRPIKVSRNDIMIEKDISNNVSPYYSSPSSTNSIIRNSCPLIKLADYHPPKLSEFSKKLILNQEEQEGGNKIIFLKNNTQGKIISPGLKESKFKPLRKIDNHKEDDIMEENELMKKCSEDSFRKRSNSPQLLSNMREEILKKNLFEKNKGKGIVLPQLKERNESLIEFYSDANFNSSELPSENSSPKITSRWHNLDLKRRDSELNEVDMIYEKSLMGNSTNLEQKLNVEKKNLDKKQFMSDSEESIFNEEEEKNCKKKNLKEDFEKIDNIEKFGMRNRTKTLLVIGGKQKTREKDKSHEMFKHKHLTDIANVENFNSFEKIKAQKDVYKSQKKLIKRNDDGIQACILFSEMFIYISENYYADRLGYKIQKVLYKLDDLAHLLPEKKKEDIQGIQEAHEFLLKYQEMGEKLQKISHILYKLQAELLKGQDSRLEREKVRKNLITKDKKQNSDSVEITKRNRFSDKTNKFNHVSLKTQTNIPIIRNSKSSLPSIHMLLGSFSDQNTPNHFKFIESSKKITSIANIHKLPEEILTTKNLEKLENNHLLSENTNKNTEYSNISFTNVALKDCKEESQFTQESVVSIKRNIPSSINLPVDEEKTNEKENIDKEFEEKIGELQITPDNKAFNYKEIPSAESIEKDEMGLININEVVPNLRGSNSIKRSTTFNEIQVRFDNKPRKKNNIEKKNQISKYMAVINLLKRNHKLDDKPNSTYETQQMHHNLKKNHGVKKSILQNILRRSSVDVLSSLISPDNITKNLSKDKLSKIKKGFSAGNSPELKKFNEIIQGPENNTMPTIVTIPSKNEFYPNHSKNFFDNFAEDDLSSSSGSSFVIQEEDYFKGYYSDSYMPTQLVSMMDVKNKEKNEIGIDNFEFINLIGKGAFGRVYLVRRKQTGDQYAMKIINTMDNMNKNKYLSLKNESKVFDLVYSDFVVKALFKFGHEKFYCFVMEYMYGGDFNKILQKYQSLDNRTSKFYIAELVLAVEHLHNLGIVHRDLKPDNILLDAKGHIKLTDFGLSEVAIATLTKHKKTPTLSREEKFKSLIQKFKINDNYAPDPNSTYKENMIKSQTETSYVNIEEKIIENESPTNQLRKSIKKANKNMHRIIGTPDYIAPEIIKGNGSLNHPCIDWWSVGVILFEFLTGIPPFNDDTPEKIFDNITNLRIEWDQISIGYEEDEMTPEAADLIKRLLCLDPEKRLGSKNVDEIKSHAFFNGTNWNHLIKSEPPIIPEIIQEEEKKGKNEIVEKDAFLKQVVTPNEKKMTKDDENSKFFDEEDECHIRYDLLEKANQITLEENYLKMQDKTIQKESSSSLSIKENILNTPLSKPDLSKLKFKASMD